MLGMSFVELSATRKEDRRAYLDDLGWPKPDKLGCSVGFPERIIKVFDDFLHDLLGKHERALGNNSTFQVRGVYVSCQMSITEHLIPDRAQRSNYIYYSIQCTKKQ